MEFRKKPIVIQATRWVMNGDHPKDNSFYYDAKPDYNPVSEKLEKEGEVVRYYRTPLMDGKNVCKHCHVTMHLHGWIDTLEGGHIVCPGDWIITGVNGEFYPCKPDIFEKTYEPVTPESLPSEKTYTEEERDKFAVNFVDWLLNADSKWGIMYGNQAERFADEEREYTIAEVLELYKKSLNGK